MEKGNRKLTVKLCPTNCVIAEHIEDIAEHIAEHEEESFRMIIIQGLNSRGLTFSKELDSTRSTYTELLFDDKINNSVSKILVSKLHVAELSLCASKNGLT